MKVTAWVVLPSILVTVLVAPVLAGALSAAPARPGEPHVLRSAAPGVAPAHPGRASAPAAARHPGYLVEARMGWAIS